VAAAYQCRRRSPFDDAGRIEVLAARPAEHGVQSPSCQTATLLAAANHREDAEVLPRAGAMDSQSIIQMARRRSDVCVPLKLGPARAAAFLYLERARGDETIRISPRDWHAAVSFCLALGRIASLALANLKRVDMERRAALIETELRAAAEAQRWILRAVM
jgi:hypothetical protein